MESTAARGTDELFNCEIAEIELTRGEGRVDTDLKELHWCLVWERKKKTTIAMDDDMSSSRGRGRIFEEEMAIRRVEEDCLMTWKVNMTRTASCCCSSSCCRWID